MSDPEAKRLLDDCIAAYFRAVMTGKIEAFNEYLALRIRIIEAMRGGNYDEG